jgi:nitrate/nitrite transporter NarK
MGGLCLGTGIGNMLCSILLPIVGWQKTFIILGIIAVFIFLGWFLILLKPHPKREKSQVKNNNITKKDNGPKENRSIYKMTITWCLAIIMVGNCWQIYSMYGVTQAMLFHYGYCLDKVGRLGFVLGIIGALSTLLGGVYSDKLSKEMLTTKARILTMFIGFIIAFLAALIVPFLVKMSLALAVLAMVLMGWGVPWTNGPYWALPVEIFPNGRAGEGAGFVGFIGNTAAVFSPLTATFIGVKMGWTLSMFFLAIGPLFAAITCLVLIHRVGPVCQQAGRKG